MDYLFAGKDQHSNKPISLTTWLAVNPYLVILPCQTVFDFLSQQTLPFHLRHNGLFGWRRPATNRSA